MSKTTVERVAELGDEWIAKGEIAPSDLGAELEIIPGLSEAVDNMADNMRARVKRREEIRKAVGP